MANPSSPITFSYQNPRPFRSSTHTAWTLDEDSAVRIEDAGKTASVPYTAIDRVYLRASRQMGVLSHALIIRTKDRKSYTLLPPFTLGAVKSPADKGMSYPAFVQSFHDRLRDAKPTGVRYVVGNTGRMALSLIALVWAVHGSYFPLRHYFETGNVDTRQLGLLGFVALVSVATIWRQRLRAYSPEKLPEMEGRGNR